MSVPTDQDLIGFVVHEARLIDEHRFEEWLDLFTEDGHYWMPLEWGQTDPLLATSLMYEDKVLLQIRIERLKGNRPFRQKPKSRCHHVLQTPQIDKRTKRRTSTSPGRRSITSRRGSMSRISMPPGRRTRLR